MIPVHLVKFVQYIENANLCSSRDFDDDWAPIGCKVRDELVSTGLCLEEDEVIIITDDTRQELAKL